MIFPSGLCTRASVFHVKPPDHGVFVKRQRVVTVVLMVLIPGVMGVGVDSSAAMRAMAMGIGYGGPPSLPPTVSSSSSTALPPAARAATSACTYARDTALASAESSAALRFWI